jgi:hypothetical protein
VRALSGDHSNCESAWRTVNTGSNPVGASRSLRRF